MTQESPTRIVPRPRSTARRDPDREVARSPLIYLASPISTYRDTARYVHMLDLARAAFPDAELLPAKGLYSGNESWRRTWPEHLKHITACLFFTDTDESVGLGVMTEIEDCLSHNLPVSLLQDDGSVIEYRRLRIELIDGGMSWRRYKRVTIRREPKKATNAES